MPTYEYKCNACKHGFEVYQSIKDSPKRKCPVCGKNALERLIGTGGAIIFKGSGFYQTDYRSESYKKAADADKAPSPSADKTESTPGGSKPESKPAETKAESKPGVPDAKPAKTKPESKEKKTKSKA